MTKRIDHGKVLTDIGLKLLEPYINNKTPHLLECLTCGHNFKAGILGKIQANKKFGTNGCPECRKNRLKGKTEDAVDNIKTKIVQQGYLILNSSELVSASDHSIRIQVKRLQCNHIFMACPISLAKGLSGCKGCSNRTTDQYSAYIDFQEMGFTSTDKHGLSLYKNESKKVVIACVDVLKCQETYFGKYTMRNLSIEYNNNGYRFLIFYSDEIKNKSSLIHKKIKHIINEACNSRIYGRKCSIRLLSTEEKRTFLNEHHIQGNDNAKINIGMFYENSLMAVMTFCQPRLFNNKNRINEVGVWELSRFASHTDHIVIGAASKLLSHFKKNYEWNEVYSYADRRWSIGNLYETLGFQLTNYGTPSYYYIVDGQRKYRFNYRKQVLASKLATFDATLTEYANMLANGIDRVWDCGTIKFVMTHK